MCSVLVICVFERIGIRVVCSVWNNEYVVGCLGCVLWLFLLCKLLNVLICVVICNKDEG